MPTLRQAEAKRFDAFERMDGRSCREVLSFFTGKPPALLGPSFLVAQVLGDSWLASVRERLIIRDRIPAGLVTSGIHGDHALKDAVCLVPHLLGHAVAEGVGLALLTV